MAGCSASGVVTTIRMLGCLQTLEVLRVTAVWALSQWQPAALGCLQKHFHRIQQLSSRANCAAGEEQPTVANPQNYEASLLWL